jgi:carbon storage regulator
MLVISRKKDEGLVINDDITVTIIEIRGDKVRLGIEVPRHVSVHRREVFEAIMAQSDRRSSPTSTPPTKITLTESQVALLERVRTSIALSGGPEPTLEQALGMLFDAVEEAEEHLTALVVDGVRGFRATSLPAQYDRISPSSSSTGSTVGDSAHSPSESRQSGQ